MSDWALWGFLDYLGALWTEAVALAWEFLAGFPHWFGVVLWPVLQIVGVGLLALVGALVLAGILWESGRKQKLRAFQRDAKGGDGWSI